MQKRSSMDSNEIAFAVVQQAVGLAPRAKNPAAVALGHLGGLKGGKARAARLTASKRKAIAKKAAKARWTKKPELM